MTARHPDKEFFLPPITHDENPLHASAFWKPRFAVDGDMLLFAPMLFWLVALLRPSRATVIGLGDGVACLALCQAMDRLHVDGICAGIRFPSDTAPDMPDPIEGHAAQFYEGLVHLQQAESPASALSCLTPGRQDLLVIDLQQSGDWPQDALDDWLSQLSPHGCLVLHGLRQMPQAGALPSMSRQMAQLSCFNIDIGAGLSVLCNDPNPPAELAGAISDGQLPRQTLSIFARLGRGLIAEARYDTMTSRLARQETALAAARHRAETLQTELADVSALLESRGRKTSEYQALYYDCDMALKTLRRAEAETLDAHTERQAKDAALAARDALAAQLRQNRETHYRETAALTLLLEEQRMSASKETDMLRQQAAASASDNAALLSSTSWKVTSPLRRIAAKISGRPRPR